MLSKLEANYATAMLIQTNFLSFDAICNGKIAISLNLI
jgi:hypothetical protein